MPNMEMKAGPGRLYEILGVGKDATDAEIKKAYRKKALKCHPDKFPGDEAKTEMFQELKHAYEELSNPALRAIYDDTGETGKPVDHPSLLSWRLLPEG